MDVLRIEGHANDVARVGFDVGVDPSDELRPEVQIEVVVAPDGFDDFHGGLATTPFFHGDHASFANLDEGI